jgi:hypothetical protein
MKKNISKRGGLQRLGKIDFRKNQSTITENSIKGAQVNKKNKMGAINRIFERQSKDTIIKFAVRIKM